MGVFVVAEATATTMGVMRFATSAEIESGEATHVAVTPSQLAQVAAGSVPAGVVDWFAGAIAPAGWLACDGSLHAKASFPALAAVLGTTYGAGTATEFQLPDLRGEWIRGADMGRGTGAGVIGEHAAGDVQAHQHEASISLDAPAASSQTVTSAASGNHAHSAATTAGGQHAHTATSEVAGWHGHGVADSLHSHYVHDPGHAHGMTNTETENLNQGSFARQFGFLNHERWAAAATMGSGTGIWLEPSAANIGIQGEGNHQHVINIDAGTNHFHPVSMEGSGDHTHNVTINVADHTHAGTVSVARTGGDENRVRSLHLLPIIKV
jgi:hypothetical protein